MTDRIPPRELNSPVIFAETGWHAFTISRKTRLTTFS